MTEIRWCFYCRKQLKPFDGMWIHVTLEGCKYPTPTKFSPKGKMKTAPEHLEVGAQTYRERNKEYGDSYHKFGQVMTALFPEGLNIGTRGKTEVEAEQEWNRLGVLTQAISKLCRYSNDFSNPHRDSVHDMMVYFAMLMELENEQDKTVQD